MDSTGDRLRRCAVLLCNKLPFAGIPIFVNLVVASILRRKDLPFFVVEDLAYFAIIVAGETTLMAWAAHEVSPGGSRQPLLLVGPFLVVFFSALAIAKWHDGTVNPTADQLFNPKLWIFTAVIATCAVLAVTAAVANFLVFSIPGGEIPSKAHLLCGTFLFALLPILTTAFTGLLDRVPYLLLRPGDICFFTIAVSGPAILDLIHCDEGIATQRGVWSVPLIALIIWSSTLLGFLYFIRLVQLAPTAEHLAPGVEIMEALQTSAIVSAVLAFVVAFGVHRRVSPRSLKTTAK